GLLALVPLILYLSGVILRVETENGALVVEMNDPAVEARIKNGKLILSGPDGKDLYTLTPGERSKEIPPGPYKVRVEGADRLALNTPEFTLTKGGKVSVRVTVAGKSVAKADPKAKSPPGDVPPAPDGEWTPLFNGKDLTGWSVAAGGTGNWKV